MSSFWPDGIELSDTQSPRDILNTAQEEWRKVSHGVLELVLQDAKSESGNSMIIVHAKHVGNKRTATLFSIVHEPEKPYPVIIQPEKEEIPDYLKKTYYKRNPLAYSFSAPNLRMALAEPVEMITNPWVSDTPSEFREKLSKAFNLGMIKREILNLASGAVREDSIDEEPIGN